MSKRAFWYILMTGAVVLWLGSVALGLYLSSKGNSYGWLLFGTLVVIHALEIKMCLTLGKRYELSNSLVVTKTMVFGFTWWVPLKRGIIDR